MDSTHWTPGEGEPDAIAAVGELSVKVERALEAMRARIAALEEELARRPAA